MDPIRNPYAPGAGTPPPELAGRDEIRSTALIALQRAKIGRPGKSIIMVGLRGVGKTVLLDRILNDAEAIGVRALRIEAPENRSLPSMLAPQLRSAMLRLSAGGTAGELARRALRGLAGFVRALKFKYRDIEVGLDFAPEPGLADNGAIWNRTCRICWRSSTAAKAAEACVALLVDELHYVKQEELAALIIALHRVSQRQLPVTMVGAGLPQVRGRMGKAKSYAERLFEFPEIGALSDEDAKLAIAKPAADEGVAIDLRTRWMRSSRERSAIRTSFRNGESTCGTPPTLPDHGLDRRYGLRTRDRGARCEFLPGPVRSAHSHGEAIPASDVRARVRPVSLRRDRAGIGHSGDLGSSPSRPIDQQGHDLEPEPRPFAAN